MSRSCRPCRAWRRPGPSRRCSSTGRPSRGPRPRRRSTAGIVGIVEDLADPVDQSAGAGRGRHGSLAGSNRTLIRSVIAAQARRRRPGRRLAGSSSGCSLRTRQTSEATPRTGSILMSVSGWPSTSSRPRSSRQRKADGPVELGEGGLADVVVDRVVGAVAGLSGGLDDGSGHLASTGLVGGRASGRPGTSPIAVSGDAERRQLTADVVLEQTAQFEDPLREDPADGRSDAPGGVRGRGPSSDDLDGVARLDLGEISSRALSNAKRTAFASENVRPTRWSDARQTTVFVDAVSLCNWAISSLRTRELALDGRASRLEMGDRERLRRSQQVRLGLQIRGRDFSQRTTHHQVREPDLDSVAGPQALKVRVVQDGAAGFIHPRPNTLAKRHVRASVGVKDASGGTFGTARSSPRQLGAGRGSRRVVRARH